MTAFFCLKDILCLQITVLDLGFSSISCQLWPLWEGYIAYRTLSGPTVPATAPIRHILHKRGYGGCHILLGIFSYIHKENIQDATEASINVKN